MDEIISQFIDDELDMDEKIVFVERVHENREFKDESVQLLRLEKRLRGEVAARVPVLMSPPRRWALPRLSLMGGLAVAACLALFYLMPGGPTVREAPLADHRFVLYQPQATHIAITGSFTGWKAVPLRRIGDSGYWEISLTIPGGEHRFSYVVDGRERLPDPTVLAREPDDFGGKNSILQVKVQA